MQIELKRMVAARPAQAFSVVAHIEEWPLIIRSVRSVELLTPGAIRAGSRLRARRVMLGHEAIEDIEVIEVEKPRRLRLVVENPDIHYELDHVIDAIAGGSRLMLIFRARAETGAGRTLLPLMTPFLEIKLRDELEQDLADLASAITAKSSPAKAAR
jgi:hypothetical protein